MGIEDIALTLQYGLGIKGVAHLLALYGDARTVYTKSAEELVAVAGLRRELAEGIASRSSFRAAEAEMKYMSRHGIAGVASTDPQYPAMLRECGDFPHVLYVLGETDVLAGRMLSVVGTRTVTPYGQRMSDVLVGRIAELEPDTVIVSGLAYGVDACAHRAALHYGLRTVGVIANPLPEVTPSVHRTLAREIVDKGGAIITELHSGTKQNGSYFIPRNRIIAGMSEGAVVVESPYKGGALSTAELAYGYQRSVMAVPGRAGDKCSEGANSLIRSRKAAMVCSGDDIVRELGWDMETAGVIPARERPAPMLTGDEKRVVECFGAGETLDMDTLIARSGVPAGQLAALLLGLELSGVLRCLPGKRYELC